MNFMLPAAHGPVPLSVEVDLLSLDYFPKRIRARQRYDSRLDTLRSTFDEGGMRMGYMIIQDLPAMKAGHPLEDFQDLVDRVNAGEEFVMWVSAGWHTTFIVRERKHQLKLLRAFREFSRVFLASTLTEPEAVGLGNWQNDLEKQQDSLVSLDGRRPANSKQHE
jgi:hypothetical protein